MVILVGLSSSISIVFCLILCATLADSDYCLAYFEEATLIIEPATIYSRGSNVTIYIQPVPTYLVENIQIYFNDDEGKTIYCGETEPLRKVNDTLIIYKCKTRSFATFDSNSTLILTLSIECEENKSTISQNYDPGTAVVDPNIETIFPLQLIVAHTNRIFLRLKSDFPSIDSFDIDIGNTNGFCDKERNGRLLIFDCFFNQSCANIFIYMNDIFWESRIVEFVPKPEIIDVTGSTFENALIPICFTVKNVSSFFDPVLYTSFSNESNPCNITSISSMCCISALGLEPIDEVNNIQAQIYSHSHPLVNVMLRQALIPVLTHTQFSFKRNELTIKLVNFETYYSPYTNIAVFDSARQFMVDCVLTEVTLETIICNPEIKISLSERNTHYVMLNISQWSTVYPQIDSFNEDLFTPFQVIMIMVASLIFIMLVSWLCIIIYYGCFDTADGIKIVPGSYFYQLRKENNEMAKNGERSHFHKIKETWK